MTIQFTTGMTVRARGERFLITNVDTLPGNRTTPLLRLTLRVLEGEMRGAEIPVLYPIEPIEPDEVPELTLERPGRLPRFRLLHDVFKISLSPPNDILIGARYARIRFEPYQYVPVLRALELPRPRLLLADDVGLGKTIEAGLILRELNARRRATRVLIVCPAGIMTQWQNELQRKFGFKFKVFDREGLYEARRQLEVGTNPWAVEPRVIASMDFIKRREGAFRELSSTRWDAAIVDEAHHLATGRSEDDITDRHRLARWLAEATDTLLLLTATPHDGYDESFASLLGLLEPNLVAPDGRIRFDQYQPHLVRRLKRHIRNADGSPKFLERKPPEPIAVELTTAEAELNGAVLSQARELDALAEHVSRHMDAEAIRLVATILRKRAASSRYALARTLEQRRANLTERIEDIEIQREHLRAMRRGDALPEESLARLERDAHLSYLSVMRRLGTQLRRAQDEVTSLEELQRLLDQCNGNPESKMAALLNHLDAIHGEYPHEKVIIFTEYSDTVQAIAHSLDETNHYKGKYCLLTGDLPPGARDGIIAEFAHPEKVFLVATDAAGEGLNLHKHCHRMVHFELPWNPNRLEQRNGRIDRYGQTKPPLIGFLYARDTYEGEVLARLVDKIERQIARLGSVGDVLGQLQVERIEQIVARAPSDVRAAIQEAEHQIDRELERIGTTPLMNILGDGSLDSEDVRRAEEAARKGLHESPDLGDFVARSVIAAGGRVERNGAIRVWTPSSWSSGSLQPVYERLIPPGSGDPEEEPSEVLLEDEHPLVAAAVRWVQASRFTRTDDHRLAYICTPQVSDPDIVVTFLLQLRDGEGAEIERLEAIPVSRHAQPSRSRGEDVGALETDSQGNVPPQMLTQLFEPWWQTAREAAMAEARRRAIQWRQSIIAMRGLEQIRLKDDLEQWDLDSRQVILGDYAREYQQQRLFGASEVPPAIKRRLRQHEERVRERRAFLDRRMLIDEPSVEPLGVLLRVPASFLQDTNATTHEGRRS
jgi:superfamily II DNA or RNA helicase